MLPDFKTVGTCGKFVSPTYWPPIPPRKYSCYPFIYKINIGHNQVSAPPVQFCVCDMLVCLLSQLLRQQLNVAVYLFITLIGD